MWWDDAKQTYFYLDEYGNIWQYDWDLEEWVLDTVNDGGDGSNDIPDNGDSGDSSDSNDQSAADKYNARVSNGIDWRKSGKLNPVKDQGSCGSCWSFTATEVYEAMIAIKNNADPFRLSEQELVDCDK